MKVFFDHNVDQRFRRALPNIEVRTARQMRCESLQNGELLRAAADAGFDAFLTLDKRMRYEHNLAKLPLLIIVIDAKSNPLPLMIHFAPHILQLPSSPLDRAMYLVEESGSGQRL